MPTKQWGNNKNRLLSSFFLHFYFSFFNVRAILCVINQSGQGIDRKSVGYPFESNQKSRLKWWRHKKLIHHLTTFRPKVSRDMWCHILFAESHNNHYKTCKHWIGLLVRENKGLPKSRLRVRNQLIKLFVCE